MNKLPVAKEAFGYLAFLTLITVIFFFICRPLIFLSIAFIAFISFFFRNPPRNVPVGDSQILSPADGRVMSVSEVVEPVFLKGKAVRVSIFLSIFDAHINRSPISGTVKYVNYRPGKFIPAFKSHASDINERNTLGIEGKNVKILVSQITGFIARRIVCWAKEGSSLSKGQCFGMIKFGSGTEIIMPDGVEINVKPGDKVKAGESIIGTVRCL